MIQEEGAADMVTIQIVQEAEEALGRFSQRRASRDGSLEIRLMHPNASLTVHFIYQMLQHWHVSAQRFTNMNRNGNEVGHNKR